MRRVFEWVLISGAAYPVLLRGQGDGAALLKEARAKIIENISKLPNYTCIQTVHRSQFETFSGLRTGCADWKDANGAANESDLKLGWTDQFKLEVTTSASGEIFSWPGARAFDVTDVQEVVGSGLTGTGDFEGFLKAIFGDEALSYQYLGMQQLDGRPAAAYRYHIPLAKSRYRIKTGSRSEDQTTIEYEGKFWIDPQNAELIRTTIETSQLPEKSEACRTETTIDYQRFQIGESRLMLPKLTFLQLWDAEGSRFENQTVYGACRAFHTESVFVPDVGLPNSGPAAIETSFTIPAGKKVEIAQRSKIDAKTAFAGDEIEGLLVQPIQGRGGQVLAPRGALVHGRIVRLEQHYLPSRYVALGLTYYSLVVNGHDIPLALESVPHSHADRLLNGPSERREGIGMFMFRGDALNMDGMSASEWKTVAKRPGK
jgi:hypothetical protein